MSYEIILDGMRFEYTDIEIAQFVKYWKEYKKSTNNTLEIIEQLAEDFNEDPDNIILLVLDQAKKGRIE